MTQIKAMKTESIVTKLTAARSAAPTVRLVANPDVGSAVIISHHVLRLLKEGVLAGSIYVLSQSLQAVRALRWQVVKHCRDAGQTYVEDVHFSSLHFLALNVSDSVESEGYDHASVPYNATWEGREGKGHPHVIDRWEAVELYDRGFASISGWSTTRCQAIRESHEALWCTGDWTPPNFVAPMPPITEEEREAFEFFNRTRTEFYMYSLQGKSVRDALPLFDNANVNPVDTLGISYIVADNYQDLNPVEIELIDCLIGAGVQALIIGDDNQSIGTSIGSTRFSWPDGFRTFVDRHHDCTTLETSGAAALTSPIAEASEQLLRNTWQDTGSGPPADYLKSENTQKAFAVTQHWKFSTGEEELAAIAASCQRLIDGGLDPSEILIALPDGGEVCQKIGFALESADIPFLHPDKVEYLTTNIGHFIVACLDIIFDNEDYISHGAFFTLVNDISPEVELSVVAKAIDHGLTVSDLFTKTFPDDNLTPDERKALQTVHDVVTALKTMNGSDLLRDRFLEIAAIARRYGGELTKQHWLDDASVFPDDCTLTELKYCIVADDLTQWESMFNAISDRLGRPLDMPKRVRVAEMRYVKGIRAAAVFVPGLVDQEFPGIGRGSYPALVQESARKLYVAMTRATRFCILTSARQRGGFADGVNLTPSRFLSSITCDSQSRTGGLTDAEHSILMK